jgi:hypothetical protein
MVQTYLAHCVKKSPTNISSAMSTPTVCRYIHKSLFFPSDLDMSSEVQLGTLCETMQLAIYPDITDSCGELWYLSTCCLLWSSEIIMT